MNGDTPESDRTRHASEGVGGLHRSLDRMIERKDLRIQALEYEASILRNKLDIEKSRVKSLEADLKSSEETVTALQELMRADEDNPGQKLEEEDVEEQAAQGVAAVAAAAVQASPQDTDAGSTVPGTSQIVSVPKKKKKKRPSGAEQRKKKKAKEAAAAEGDGK